MTHGCSRQSMVLPLVALLAIPAPARAQDRDGTRWRANGTALAEFHVAVDSTVARTGRASIRIAAPHEPSGFGGALTSFPAAPWLGQRIRLSAQLRTDALTGSGASLWLRADGTSSNVVGFVSTQGTRTIAGTSDWTEVAVELDVSKEASTLFLGALSTGEGTLWVDDVRIAPVGASGGASVAAARVLGFEPTDSLAGTPPPPRLAASPREPARALGARGLDNLVAFTRLAAYVRFFHPADSVVATNWDEFTIGGIRAVEKAPTPDSLAATLRALFAPMAPTVAIAPAGRLVATPPPMPRDARGVLFWQHFGFGAPLAPGTSTGIYHSTRRRVPLLNGRAPDSAASMAPGRLPGGPVPSPERPFVVDLGGGVTASIPLALYADSTATDRRASIVAPREALSANDRATRLGVVALLWMVPRHFYPYFDVVTTDWDGALRDALSAAATADSREKLDATLERLVAALRDGHGGVYRSGMTRATPDVRFGWVEERVIVTAVGDSAAAAGVRRGDELLAVDGRAVGDVLREVESRTSGATDRWVRSVALGRLAAGEPRTAVSLTLRSAGQSGRGRDVRLARGGTVPREPRPEKIAEVRPGILYVDLDRVTDADVDSAMPRLQAARGVVFDMRGYPRQVNTPRVLALLTDTIIHSARFQIPLVTAPDTKGMVYSGDGWLVQPRQPRLRARVAFLSGGGAISYAESTLGVVEENALGPIVGEASAGTNGNVNPVTLPLGYRFAWTGMRVVKRDGTPHHGVGIRATVPVRPTRQDVLRGRDAVLERALDLVDVPRS